MRTERLVLDTNAFVSALLFESSMPAQVLDHACKHCHLIFTSHTQRELIATMTSAKLERYVRAVEREQLLLRVASLIELTAVWQLVRVCRDQHDDAVLEAALNGGAAAIVTGDKDFLALHPFRGIAILTPAAYLSAAPSENEPQP